MYYTCLFSNIEVGNADGILLVLSTYFSTIFHEVLIFIRHFFKFKIANISRVFLLCVNRMSCYIWRTTLKIWLMKLTY